MRSSLPNYVLSDTLHETDTTIIHRGHRIADHAPVTVKLLKHEHPTPRDIAKLRHEYAVMKSLRIPGILTAYALERLSNGLALVMEDRGGQPLDKILGEQRLDVGTVLHIASALAKILDSLHRARVIHKDVKPSNILYDPRTHEVTLIDFGIATRISQEVQLPTAPELIEGTHAYMSPEQTGRMNRHIDHRTDFYSLGVTLYEMLTGVRPFRSTDAMELLHSHIARMPVPPHELAPEIPRAVSDITMKLLAKAAEDRYQQAYGLRADLDECLRQWEANGWIGPMALGRLDLGGELRVPQKLYGREDDERALLAAWGRASEGRAECLLVAGYAGVGKSVLVNEMHKAIARRSGGYFVAGKFDKLNRSVPYAPFVHAFRELIRRILTEPAEALARWQGKLRRALGQSGQLIADLIPELSLLLGPQPSLSELAPAEAQNRFALVFESFVRVFTSEEHPLAIFLDDLQWADSASLRLLHILLAGPQSRYLLVIGAYRDNEVEPGHPLLSALDELRKEGAPIRSITLAPLSPRAVGDMIGDTLGCGAEACAPLAEVVFAKTHGNPFFINQLLRDLHKQELIAFDARARSWVWDLERIQQANITDNVVDFMMHKLRGLAPSTQRALKLAACIGHQFALRTLATLSEQSMAETAATLWEALQEGLVLPLDSDYRFLDVAPSGSAELPATESFDVSYKFLHDRVQHAAYGLLEDGRERETHLRIGRLMLAGRAPSALGEELFDITNHLDIGAALITDPAERAMLARLNLAAGRRAKAAAAHQAAAGYLGAGLALLSVSSWDEDRDLAFWLHVEQAECEAINGRMGASDALFEALLARSLTKLELAHVHCLRMNLCTTAGRLPEAIQAGLRGLALFGVEIPESEEARKALLAREMEAVAANLGERRIEDLVNAPEMTDPERRAVQKLLIFLTSPAYYEGPTFIALVALKQVDISLRYGHSDGSAYGYVLFGFILSGGMDRYEEGYRYGRLALALQERFGSAELTAKVNMVFGVFLHFCRPVREALAYYRRAYESDLVSGDFVYTSHACFYTMIVRLSLGEELSAVREELDRFLALTQRTKEAMAIGFLTIAKHTLAALTGRTASRTSLAGESFDEAAFVASQEAAGAHFITCWYYTVKAQLFYLHGDPRSALEMAKRAEERLGSSAGQYFATELSFYLCMASHALSAGASPEERARYAAAAEPHREKLARLAESCPENFRQKLLLVQAEEARAAGREAEAIDLYDAAIVAARENGFTSLEALANELCARLYLSKGKTRVAHIYMSDAHYAYLRWGATAKADDLADRYSHLLPPAAALPPTNVATRVAADLRSLTTTTTTTRALAAELFEAAAVVRSAQAIAAELVLDKVVEQVLKLVIEIGGAQRAVLLLGRDTNLRIAASITVEPDRVELGLSTPLEESAGLPRTIVQYVARTREPLVLGDAGTESRFSADPYIAKTPPKSVLCLSMVQKGELAGILYMENNAVKDAFTPRQIEHCTLLASQAAIAVANALLYQQLQVMTGELKRSNEALESEVARRTAELYDANERLSRELSERARGEEERARLQEEVIRAQSARLVELSTPMIPITDRIMVMPLIGAIDEQRAEQVLTTALEGAQTHRAEVVIIDITGVKVMDTAVASTLLRTAAALKLLGAEAMLTGLSREVAQTLICLGLDLGGIVTMGTLRSGIARALKRSGSAALTRG
ncbi:AAA family ATPase [Polyangium sp. y55x31]|uniref:AAA family ATPase n=1 Tax=Polyangium sp. y55x31 TaxID=3042688 RepID=UPI00248276AE|nr:AAA family ATPase [Polyangium sp. y55x31]MDI1475976.1 AAA family ATPase [Polyangium sp. y55x31]